MADTAPEIRTGAVVGEYSGPDGDEIAVAVRLPCAAWERLTKGLYPIYMYGNEGRDMDDSDVPLADRIAVFLYLAEAGWDADVETEPVWKLAEPGGDVPF